MVGILWMWINIRNTKNYEITNYKQQVTINNNQITDNTKQITDDNKTIEQLDNIVVTSTSVTEEKDLLVLPQNYLLKVPFTSQAPEKNWEQPWQDACEEVALLMLDAYYKNYNLSPLFSRDEILKMVKWEEERGWGGSIEIEKVKQMAEEYLKISDFRFQILENPTIEQIKKSIANRHPVLVVADGKVLPNPHFRSGGPVYHALIIKGYTETEFITNDPGTQFGEGFKYKYNDLMNAIRDWNGGNVKEGRRVVLIVE